MRGDAHKGFCEAVTIGKVVKYHITELHDILHDKGLYRQVFFVQCNYVLVRSYTLQILHDFNVL